MCCTGGKGHEIAWILEPNAPAPTAAADPKGPAAPKDAGGGAPKDLVTSTKWSEEHVGCGQEQNPSFRPTMEDTLYINLKFGPKQDMVCIAVFDGHGGVAASELAATWIPRELEAALERSGPTVDFAAVFKDVFKRSDDVYKEKGIQYEGSTAVVGVFEKATTGWKLHVASAGDSKAALNRNGVAEFVSDAHTLENEREKERITTSGGFVARGKVNGMLAVTRSLGDLFLKEVVISEPQVTSFDLKDTDDYIVFACDGVWDVTGKQAAIEIAAAASTTKEAADKIVAHSLEAGTTDNITAIVVRFPWIKR